MNGESKSDAQLELAISWLNDFVPLPCPPAIKQPFTRTRFMNDKRDGCYCCPRKSTLTKHHINRGPEPLVVYLCWKDHQIIHGTALDRFDIKDLKRVMAMADAYGLYKEGETNVVKKKILMEITIREDRKQRIKNNKKIQRKFKRINNKILKKNRKT